MAIIKCYNYCFSGNMPSEMEDTKPKQGRQAGRQEFDSLSSFNQVLIVASAYWAAKVLNSHVWL
jgi:hypothetical protein